MLRLAHKGMACAVVLGTTVVAIVSVAPAAVEKAKPAPASVSVATPAPAKGLGCNLDIVAWLTP